MRRYAGSSAMEATRPVSVAPPSPPTPRAPKNAPVPPVMVTFACKKLEGAPGGFGAPPQPVAMMVPTCVPSACLTSKIQSKKNEAVIPVRDVNVARPVGGHAVRQIQLRARARAGKRHGRSQLVVAPIAGNAASRDR